ncbi:hypothetical protein DFJ74DRAFT_708046 [Hyaloraphidium curvatum]|nr:hypothetical protein DFJ74DRAFT_708046 [Hyaloraphidium curvatum]
MLLVLATLLVPLSLLNGKARPPSSVAQAPPGRRCLLFARVANPNHGLNNQLTSIFRTADVARRLGCRVLPANIGAHGAAALHVPLERNFDTGEGTIFANLDDPEEAKWVARLASEAAGRQRASGITPPDRAAHSIDPNSNPEPLSIPCLVGLASVDDPRTNTTQPFRCSHHLVLESWFTHPADPSADPTSDPRAAHLWKATEGKLIGVPVPYGLNVSCAVELEVSRLLRPRGELLRAAKWLLWNLILNTRGISAEEATALLGRTPSLPDLRSPAYAGFPGPGPAPILLTAHIRGSIDHRIMCRHKMRFPLCGTTFGRATDFLVRRIREIGCGHGAVRVLLAGETLGNPAFQHREGATVVRKGMAELAVGACPPRVLSTGGDLASLYPAVLFHPSLAFSVANEDREAHLRISGAILDQILLACGDFLGRAGGGFFQTRESSFSARAWAMGAAVGAEVCLPSAFAPIELSAEMTVDEQAFEAEAIAFSGADFSRPFSARCKTRTTLRPGESANGCSSKGRFLPSLTWEERDALPDDTDICPGCFAKERW